MKLKIAFLYCTLLALPLITTTACSANSANSASTESVKSIATTNGANSADTSAVDKNNFGPTDIETTQPTLITKKETFSIESFTTFGGKTINNLKVGWEAYGHLNADKSNVILITHHFSGTSHAAGVYEENEEKTSPNIGYWDALIGSGKAIDTDIYYVVSVDSLVNLNAYDENVITTGPATINPETGKPWGLEFPVVTIRDFVNVQKALLESLGVQKLHAVVGPSMGSMQAIDWASAYPDWVPRIISVIGTGESDAWTTAALSHWAMPIRLDGNWQQGRYAQNNQPIEGLVASLMMITQHALYPTYFNQEGNKLGYHAVEQAPLENINAQHSIVKWLESRARQRAEKMDANHLLYLVRACQLFVAGHGNNMEEGLKHIQAKTLFLPASTDLLLMPYLAEAANNQLKQLGKNSELKTLNGPFGHLEGIVNVQAEGERIAAFLSSDL